jgi:hypothetical protein
MHWTLPLHLLPQLPQFLASAPTFTQLPLQLVLPEAQLTSHWPPLQIAVPPATAGHFLPHVPQLFTSARGSIQLDEQAMYGL